VAGGKQSLLGEFLLLRKLFLKLFLILEKLFFNMSAKLWGTIYLAVDCWSVPVAAQLLLQMDRFPWLLKFLM
jgi:hypothetical protein